MSDGIQISAEWLRLAAAALAGGAVLALLVATARLLYVKLSRPEASSPSDATQCSALGVSLGISTILDEAPVMLWATDARQQAIWVNTRWTEFTGMTFEDSLGTGWLEAVHPDDVGRVAGECYNAQRSGRRHVCVFRAKRYDGEWRWLEATGDIMTCDGADHGFIGACLDVTERQTARRREAMLAAVVEHSEAMMGVATSDGTPVLLNKAGRTLLGVGQDQPLNDLKLADFYDSDAAIHWHSVVLPTVKSTGRWMGQTRHLHVNGEPRPVRKEVFRIDDPDVEGLSYLGTICHALPECCAHTAVDLAAKAKELANDAWPDAADGDAEARVVADALKLASQASAERR